MKFDVECVAILMEIIQMKEDQLIARLEDRSQTINMDVREETFVVFLSH